MKRLLLAATLLAGLAACEPEYAESAGTAGAAHAPGGADGGAEAGEHPEVTGGADPTAVSGPVPGDSGTIHHPAADGNSGRPADGRAD